MLLLITGSLFCACGNVENVALIHKNEGAIVDNFSKNSEIVDNLQEMSDNDEAFGWFDVETTADAAENAEAEEEASMNWSEQSTEDVDNGAQISILMVGDMLMHTPVEESALQADGSYCYDAIFANTKEAIQEADLAIVNQEVIIGGEALGISGYPAFNAPFALGHDLVEAGFDVICHATNHALDKGKKGLLNCLSFWEENYPEITVLGIHESKADQQEIFIYEQNGIKIAVLNFTYGTNGIALPSDMPYAVDMLEEAAVKAALEKAQELSDFVIVCPHWGTEYVLEQTKEQEKWAGIFWENGVDLVLGTHPHVIEPIEMRTEEESGRSMLIYYSLGNFVNWTSSSGQGIANRMVGGMAQVTVGRNEAGEAVILEYGIEPVVTHLTEGSNGVSTYFLKDYTFALAEENEICRQDGSFSLEYCEALCDKVWGELWRE